MFDTKKLDALAKRLSDALPEGIKHLSADVEENFRSILQSTFAKLDLVNREEFDIQTKVLAETRRKLDELTLQVSEIEKNLSLSSCQHNNDFEVD